MGMFRITKKEADVSAVTPEEKTAVVETPEPVGEKTPKAENEDINGVPIKNVDLSKIVIDGPLSETYTKVLNLVYAKEANVTEIHLLKEKTDEEKEDVEESSYIYVVDGACVENEDGEYVEALEHIRIATGKYKKVAVCVEHHMNITMKVGKLLTYAREHGAIVYSSREKAISSIATEALGL